MEHWTVVDRRHMRWQTWQSNIDGLFRKWPNSLFCVLVVLSFAGWSGLLIAKYFRDMQQIAATQISLTHGSLDSLCSSEWRYSLGFIVQNDAIEYKLQSVTMDVFLLHVDNGRELLMSTHFSSETLSELGRLGRVETVLTSTLDFKELALQSLIASIVRDYNELRWDSQREGMLFLSRRKFALVTTASVTVWLFGLALTRRVVLETELDTGKSTSSDKSDRKSDSSSDRNSSNHNSNSDSNNSGKFNQDGATWKFSLMKPKIRMDFSTGVQFLAMQAQVWRSETNVSRAECFPTDSLVRDNFTVYVPGLESVLRMENSSLLPFVLPPFNLTASIQRFWNRSASQCQSHVLFAQSYPAAYEWQPLHFLSWPFLLPQEAIGRDDLELGKMRRGLNLTLLVANSGIEQPVFRQGRRTWVESLDLHSFGPQHYVGIQPSSGSSSCFLNRLLSFNDLHMNFRQFLASKETMRRSKASDLDPPGPYGLAVKSVKWLEEAGKESSDCFTLQVQADFSPKQHLSEMEVDISIKGNFTGISFNVTSAPEPRSFSSSSSPKLSSVTISLAPIDVYSDYYIYNFFFTFCIGDRESFGDLVSEVARPSCNERPTWQVLLGCAPSWQPEICPTNVLSSLLDSIPFVFKLGKHRIDVVQFLSKYISWDSFRVVDYATTPSQLHLTSSISIPASSSLGIPALNFRPMLFVRYDGLTVMSISSALTASAALGAELKLQSDIVLFSTPTASYVWSCLASGVKTQDALTIRFARGVFGFDFPFCLVRRKIAEAGESRPTLRSLVLQPTSLSCSNVSSSARQYFSWSYLEELVAARWNVNLPVTNRLPFPGTYSLLSLQGSLLYPSGDLLQIQQADLHCTTSSVLYLDVESAGILEVHGCTVPTSGIPADSLLSSRQAELAAGGCPLPSQACQSRSGWYAGTGWTDATLQVDTSKVGSHCRWNASIDFQQGCNHYAGCSGELCNSSTCELGNAAVPLCSVLGCVPASPELRARVTAGTGSFFIVLNFPLTDVNTP